MPHKPDSLWTLLHEKIKAQGVLTYGEMCQLCAEEEYKVDTARRRIDDMSDVEPLKKIGKRGGEYTYAWRLKDTVPVVDSTAPKGMLFTYRIDPKHAATKFNDPS
jgi:hypothetical protein